MKRIFKISLVALVAVLAGSRIADRVRFVGDDQVGVVPTAIHDGPYARDLERQIHVEPGILCLDNPVLMQAIRRRNGAPLVNQRLPVADKSGFSAALSVA